MTPPFVVAAPRKVILKIESMSRPMRFRGMPMLALVAALLLGACGRSSEQDLVDAVQKHLQSGDLKAAAIELKAYLADHTTSAKGRFLLGKTLNAQGDPRAAELEFRKALQLKYPAREVVPLLAKAMLATGQFTKVVDEFGATSLADSRADADLRTSIGIAYSRSDRSDLALSAFDQALALEPSLAAAKLAKAKVVALSGDVAAALRTVDEVIGADGTNAEAMEAKGDLLLYGSRNLDAALEAYRRALAIKPELIPSHLGRLEILLYRADVTGARQQYEALRKVAPDHLATRFVEAQLAYISADYPRARTLIQALLRVLPDNSRLLILSGAVDMQLKAYVQAETSFGKASHRDPSAALPRKLLAQTHLLMGQHANALADLAPLLEVQAPDAVVLSLAAEAHLQAGNLDKADQFFRSAASASPGDVGIRTSAALARLAKGHTESALAELLEVSTTDKGTTADLALISALFRRGELDAALAAAARLETKQPDRPMPAHLTGRIHLAKNDRSAARKSFERAFKLDETYFPAVSSLAQLDVAEKNVPAARQRLEALLKKNPRSADAKMALIELKIFEKAPKDEVAKLLTALIATDPSFAPARLKLVELHLANRAAKSAVAVAQDAVTAFPGNPDFLNALGRSQIASSELQQALTSFSKLSSLFPNRAEPLLRMADVQVMQGNSAAAFATLKRALELAPTNREINRRLMALSLSSKQPEKAIAMARELQRRQPKDAAGYLFEAEIEAARKQWPAVIAVLRKGIDNATAQSAAMSTRLYVAYVSADKPADAEAFAAAWMKNHPRDHSFPTRLGELLLMRSDWGGSEKYFLAALRLEPRSASVLNNLAWLTLRQKKKGAVVYSRQAAALAPDHLPILDTHAMALADDGKFDEAIALAKRVVAKAPEAHGYHLTMAKVYLAAGKRDLARPELERLAKLGPTFNESAEVTRLIAEMGPH